MGHPGKLSVPAHSADDRGSLLSELGMYARFAARLPGFLRQRLTLEQAEAIVRRRLRERDANFLRVVERGIFGHPHSPYLPLLKRAGCELGDIRAMVHGRGLEDTLRALREAGVYITFEEFKGRAAIARTGLELPVRARDFDNPHLGRYYYHARTGGSTGPGTRVSIDLDHLAAAAPFMMLAYAAHGLLGVPTVLWRGGPPDTSAFGVLLRDSLFGPPPRKWFTPISSRDLAPSLRDRLATLYTVAAARSVGVPLPWPEPLPLDRAVVVARWAAGLVARHGACHVRSSVSRALRVSLAARDAGLDLTGVTFLGAGEPPTPAKVAGMRASGARWVPNYGMTEAGTIAFGCAHPIGGNDLHLRADGFALITRRQPAAAGGEDVETFLVTTLLATAPKLLLNVDTDDYGILETRECGCSLEALGLPQHLRDILSVSKLTGEGVTLVGTEMLRILEEVLPARFGGSPLDYQLAEEEDGQGFTRLVLRVSPGVGAMDDEAVLDAVRGALRRSSGAADLARAYWDQAGTLQVRREQPLATAGGKLLPLQAIRRARAVGANRPQARG